MRFLTTIAFAACFSASALSANASVYWCFRLPFTGGWAAGYAPAPAYGGYGLYNTYGGYAPFNGGLYSARYGGYSSYGSLCCQSSCLSCNNGCLTGCGSSCGGSSCGAACSGSVTSDKVPGPVDDPGFREGNGRSPDGSEDDRDGDLDKNWESGRDRGDSERDGDSESSERSRRKPWETDNKSDAAPEDDNALDGFNERLSPNRESTPDDFGAPNEFRAPDETGDLFNERFDSDGDGLDGLQPADNGQLNFKPELSEPMDESDDNAGNGSDVIVPPAGHEAGQETRLFRGLLTEDQARTNHSELPSRFRLASQRLPQQQRASRLIGKNNKKSRALKWIGAPATDGRVRL